MYLVVLNVDELEKFNLWLKSCSKVDVKKKMKYALIDIEELEWRARHGYKYD